MQLLLLLTGLGMVSQPIPKTRPHPAPHPKDAKGKNKWRKNAPYPADTFFYNTVIASNNTVFRLITLLFYDKSTRRTCQEKVYENVFINLPGGIKQKKISENEWKIMKITFRGKKLVKIMKITNIIQQKQWFIEQN